MTKFNISETQDVNDNNDELVGERERVGGGGGQ